MGTLHKSINQLKLHFILLAVTLIFSSIFVSTFAQLTPSDCRTGCTSNDVQIKAAYLSTANGTALGNDFVCPGSGIASVYLTLELTTKTPRVGVAIYAKVKNFTPPNTVGSEIATIAECFGIALNQPTNKVTFQQPFNWSCGSSIVLTDVFIGWGTGNSDFCAGSSAFRCPATSSKCYSLPPNSYIAIQTPTPNNESDEKCSETSASYLAHFDLTEYESEIKDGQNVTIKWYRSYSEGVYSNEITGSDITNFEVTSASTTVYAKVCDAVNTSVCSKAELTLTVKPKPAAPVLSKVDNCNGTTTITAKDASDVNIAASELNWSNGATINPITVSNTTEVTATRTVNGCTSTTSNSITPAPKTTPSAPVLSKVDNCNGTTTITAKEGENVISGSELNWSGTNETGNPIVVNTINAISATRTVNGCTSATSNSITPAPKTTPTAPVLSKVDNCNGTSTITAKDGDNVISGSELNWTGTSETGNPIVVNTTGAITATRTVNGCTSSASNSVTPAPGSAPGSPNVTYLAPACDETTFKVRVNSPTTGVTYSIKDKNGNAIAGVKVGATTTSSYEAPNSNNFEFSNIPAGSGYQVTATSGNCSSGETSCGTPEEIGSTRSQGSEVQENNVTTQEIIIPSSRKLGIKAFPNPYSDVIRFVINSEESGQGRLELFNMLGQKVKTVYQGNIAVGVQNYEVSVPAQHRSTLIYIMTLNGKQFTGKLLNSSK
jgi:hypothetical protein